MSNESQNEPHFNGATLIKPSITEDKVIPFSEAIPLISDPSSDQFNFTNLDICSEHATCVTSTSSLYIN